MLRSTYADPACGSAAPAGTPRPSCRYHPPRRKKRISASCNLSCFAPSGRLDLHEGRAVLARNPFSEPPTRHHASSVRCRPPAPAWYRWQNSRAVLATAQEQCSRHDRAIFVRKVIIRRTKILFLLVTNAASAQIITPRRDFFLLGLQAAQRHEHHVTRNGEDSQRRNIKTARKASGCRPCRSAWNFRVRQSAPGRLGAVS